MQKAVSAEFFYRIKCMKNGRYWDRTSGPCPRVIWGYVLCLDTFKDDICQ